MSYGNPPPPPPPPQYGAPVPGMPGEQKNSGKAIAALVTGLVGLLTLCCGFFVVSSIAGIILGILARKEIAASNGQLKGDQMALAGLITGIIGVVLVVVSVILVVTGVIDTNFDFETT